MDVAQYTEHTLASLAIELTQNEDVHTMMRFQV